MTRWREWTDAERALMLAASERVELTFRRSMDAFRSSGVDGRWYHEQADHLGRIDQLEGVPDGSAILTAVALAPRQKWGAVLRAVPAVLRGEEVRGFYGHNVRKAREGVGRLRAGEPRSGVFHDLFPSTTSPKSRAFAANLLGEEWPVTVDVWAARIADLPIGTVHQYRMAAHAYVLAADRLVLPPMRVQEVTWQGVREFGVPMPVVPALGLTVPGAVYGRSGRPLKGAWTPEGGDAAPGG